MTSAEVSSTAAKGTIRLFLTPDTTTASVLQLPFAKLYFFSVERERKSATLGRVDKAGQRAVEDACRCVLDDYEFHLDLSGGASGGSARAGGIGGVSLGDVGRLRPRLTKLSGSVVAATRSSNGPEIHGRLVRRHHLHRFIYVSEA